MILPTPRPHSANRPATASLLVGVSAPFAQSPITCVDRSGSLRTPKETSGTLGALLTALPHVRLPIFAHDPVTAPPAALTSSSKSSSAQFQIPFVPSTHRLPLVVCRVLCCGACSSSTSSCQLLLSGTQPPDPRLTRLPQTQSADCLSARIRTSRPRLPLSSMPRASTPSFPRITVSRGSSAQAHLTSGFRHISQRARLDN